MTMQADIPAHAEMLDECAALKFEKVPSRYVPGVLAITARVHCPGCAKVHAYPGLHKTLTCDGCGLSIQNAMRGLFVWRDAPDQKVARINRPKPELTILDAG